MLIVEYIGEYHDVRRIKVQEVGENDTMQIQVIPYSSPNIVKVAK
jgi:hypothetical protein